MPIRDPYFPEPLPDHFEKQSGWGDPAVYYSPLYNVIIRARRGQGGPYFHGAWWVDRDGNCMDPEKCGEFAHQDWWITIEQIEDRLNANVFDWEQPEFVPPEYDEPRWGPRRHEQPQQPAIPEDKPHRKWWYMGYGQLRDEVVIDGISYDVGWRYQEDAPVVGDVLPSSFHWEGDEPTSEELRGTSVWRTRELAETYAKWSDGFMVLLRGVIVGTGAEPGEALMEDATVMKVYPWSRGYYQGYGGNMSDIERRAEELAWRNTRDSIWEGPEDDSDPANWALTVSRSRDSDPLGVSNFEVISEDILRRFPDDAEVHRFRHWAVGWVDHLFVRIRDDRGNITPAFEAIVEWEEQLSDYPVADEEHLSETEQEMGYDPEEGY